MTVSITSLAAPVEAARDVWMPIGPLGGTLYSLAVDPTNPNVIYAPLNGKLYFTEDGGASWNTKPACPSGVWKVLIEPQDPDVLYAFATGTLHKSADAGNTWTQIAGSVMSFARDPNYPNRLFVGGWYGSVRKSVDGGDTWTELPTGSGSVISALAVSPVDSLTLYAGTSGDCDYPGEGVYASTNGGLTWALTSSGLPHTDIKTLFVDPLHPDTVFAATSGGCLYSGYGLYRSTDGGQSWSAANTGLPCTYCPYEIWVDDLKALPGRSGEFCAVVNGEGFYTVNGGDTWNRFVPCVNDVMLTVEFLPTDAYTAFFGCAHGVWKITLTSCERSGVVPIGLSGIAVDASTSGLFGVAGIAYISRDGGLTWELSSNGADWGSATDIAINPLNGNILYVGDYNGPAEVYRSDDGGMSWDTALADISVNDIEIDPASPNIVYAGGLDAPSVGGLFKSVDDGISWTKIQGSIVMSIAVNPIDHNTIYIGTQLEGIKKSTDGGTSWDSINNGLPPCVVSTSGFILTIAIDPLNPDILYCGTYCGTNSYGVFKSTNAGEEWTAANTGLTTMYVRKIVIDYLRPSILYAQSFGAGVFRSIDGARTWEAMNAGLPGLDLGDLVMDPVSPNVLYCCGRSGLFRYESSFNPATDAGSTGVPPIDIRNFPNPFSTGTTIEYSVATPSHVRLKVYDVAGREVITLVDTRLGPGRYRADMRGTGLGTGVYFIKGSFGNRTVTRKCILIK